MLHSLSLASIEPVLIPVIAIIGGLTIAIIAIIAKLFQGMHRTRHREESRREIAAYIAEGSMTPEEGREILEAGAKADRKCGL